MILIIKQQFLEMKEAGDHAINQLKERDIHYRPTKTSESISDVIEFWTQHTVATFAPTTEWKKLSPQQQWELSWQITFESVQAKELEAELLEQLTQCAYTVGQIVYIAKQKQQEHWQSRFISDEDRKQLEVFGRIIK